MAGLRRIAATSVQRLAAGTRTMQPRTQQPTIENERRGKLDVLRKSLITREWDYFDTRLFGAMTFPGDTGAFNFAQFLSPLGFFNVQGRLGTQNNAYSSIGDVNKLAKDFVCTTIGVDVFCDTDCASAVGIATASAFVETVVHNSILRFDDAGTDPMLMLPVSDCPSGGGVWYGPKIRTQAAAADSDSSAANNGEPTTLARGRLREPIFFKAGSPFTCSLITPSNQGGTAGPLQRIQGLTALAGNNTAGIRVKLIGIRLDSALPDWVTTGDLRYLLGV